jgi:hypothetical protein
LVEGDLTFSATKIDLNKGDGDCTMPEGATADTEKLEHLSAHAASFAQSPFACLSQSCPCGQHSDGAARSEVPGKKMRALAPATGSPAIEIATRAMMTARTMPMTRPELQAGLPCGQVTLP